MQTEEKIEIEPNGKTAIYWEDKAGHIWHRVCEGEETETFKSPHLAEHVRIDTLLGYEIQGVDEMLSHQAS